MQTAIRMKYFNKKSITLLTICLAIAGAQSFAQRDHDEEAPRNLKVLPKKTSGEEVHKIMRGYAEALGVRCNYCHAKGEGRGLDFASDEKPEKEIARKMMRMVNDINDNYMAKMEGGKLDRVSCITCHNGNPHPQATASKGEEGGDKKMDTDHGKDHDTKRDKN